MAPPISVVMPLYNAGRLVAEALESIQAQTLPVREVIVVDDGSTDGSGELAASFPFVTLIRQENKGINLTLNRGLDNVTGEYLAFLDADDRWLPEKTRLQMSALEAEPHLDMVFGYCRRFRSSDEGGKQVEVILDTIPGLAKSSMLIRRSSFEKAGRFPETIEGHDFMSWYFRAKEVKLCSKMLPEIVSERRIHQANFGVMNRDFQKQSYFTTLKATLDRRRAAQAAQSQS